MADNIIIVGGKRVCIRLIGLLKRKAQYNITVIEDNRKTLKDIEDKFDDVNIIKGDATNKAVLEQAGIADADIIVAATSIDEVNLLIGILSQNYNLKKIIARTANPSHIKMFKKLGLNEVVSPELTACIDIQKHIVEPKSQTINNGGKKQYEIIKVPVKSSKAIGKEIGALSPADDYIIMLCTKGDRELIAQNNIILEKGDILTILAKSRKIKKVNKFFTKDRLI